MGERWQQIELRYHAARERDAKERAAFLAEACAGDEGLRRSLLAYEDKAKNFIESPALDFAAKMIAEEPGATVATGQTINHYKKITAPLGHCIDPTTFMLYANSDDAICQLAAEK